MDKSKCIIWRGTKDKDGYGRVCINHTTEIRAHRLSYLLFKGKLDKKLMVCHTCDNPSCINPKHLFLGTALDNNRDAIKKGRAVRVKGEEHGGSKLTWKQVREIRNMGLTHMYTHKDIAEFYGVSRELIGQIIRKKIWL